jgi:sugar-phosphatase
VPTGVLFDIDGVLIDSAAMHQATWGAWADLRAIDRATMFTGIHGERGFDTILRVAPHLIVDVELEMLAMLLADHEHKAEPFPDALALLERYAGRCGLVTSGPRDGTLARFERLGLPVPSVVVCGSDTERGKPDPEPFLLGARLLGLDPADCVVVEDAPAGIAAGKAAGCHVLAVTTSVPASECADADEVHEDLASVARRLEVLLSP